ncbi:hypothetical protein AWC38_SpisGene2368 [Stylophora pistillata]|uniref:Endonuclease/exonuclease/phosphatase domain-containing protein n=1 Tax=Stylophora pistillata TaxID=50429 RepID=A0A2B4SU83_STYPI|nr:hypothetical protein AWC38_SpisGene2368 [Stylophora pistillata]
MGGGVAVLCRNDFKIEMFSFMETHFLEIVWCKILPPNSEYYVASVYHPPDPIYDTWELLDFISNSCDEVLHNDPNAKIIIAGDINQLNIGEFIEQHSMQQLIKVPTRGNRTLDVFITNYPFFWKPGSSVKGLVRSDHFAIIVHPSTPAKPSRKKVSFRDTREHCKIAMNLRLEEYDWSVLSSLADLDESVELLSQKLWEMYDDSLPLITVKLSSRDPPYMSPLVKHLCKIRNENARTDSDVMRATRQEKINDLIRKNQINAVRNENRKHHSGFKGWWDMANKITGRKTQGTLVSKVINPDDINAYFQSISTDDAHVAPEPLEIPDGASLSKR